MSCSDDAAFEEFFTMWRRKLIPYGIGQGASVSDAEDAAQALFMRTLDRWRTVRSQDAYIRRAMKNELAATAKRRRADLARTEGWLSRRAEPAATDTYHRDELDVVRECLTILPQRQREVIASLFEGYQPREIAGALGISPSTVRSHRHYAHETLEPFIAGDGHELRRWMRSGERVYEAFHHGETLPALPRPVIVWAWTVAKNLGVDPERGAEMAPLSQDELARRRRECPIAAYPWVHDAMVELAETTGAMMVIVDTDGTVLWRGGTRTVLDSADLMGFVEGAYWDMEHAGVNGIALALMVGKTVTVSRWEHWVQTQHGHSCVAAPVRHPRDKR